MTRSDTRRTPQVGYDPQTSTYHAQHDWSGSESLYYTVCTAVAAVTGVNLTAMAPLTDAVEPDALESLFDPTQSSTVTTDHATFTYDGCQVTVYRDGHVRIVP